MGRLATALALSAGLLAAAHVAACVLPGEPSGAGRIQFTLDSAHPYRVPLAGVVEPLITISADGQVLNNPSYRLETLDTGVVRVDSTERRLLGVARGTAAVRVTYLGTTGTPDTVFPVQVVISRVAVDTPSPVTRLGATVRLSALAFDANSAVVPNVGLTWSSADSGVARVDQTGLVTAANEGVVTITAAADSVAGSASVVVTQLAAQVRVAPGIDTLRTVGRSAQFIAVAFDTNGRVLVAAKPRWSSSDTSIVRVDSTGHATAIRGGSAHIIARVGTAADTATLVVVQVVRFLTVAPGLDTMTAIQDSGRIVATAADTLGNPIPSPSLAWATGDPTIATVDQTGRVIATGSGVVLVTASSAGQSAFATVLVRQDVATVQVSAHSVALAGQGDTLHLGATGLDRNGYPVAGVGFTWRSGYSCVATVDLAGLVTAQGEGETGIVATALNSGQSDSAAVTVAVGPNPCAGAAIAFEMYPLAGIEVIGADGSGSAAWMADPGAYLKLGDPAWSPDGSILAFSWNCALYTRRFDGSEASHRVTPAVSLDDYPYFHCDGNPAWSPDGATIAFNRWYPSSESAHAQGAQFAQSIWLVNADGSNPRRFAGSNTASDIWDAYPAWSPDGTKLAFYVADGCGWDDCLDDIYVANADGTGVVSITDGRGYGPGITQPAWSPDGSQLAFVSNGNQIWLMNRDGSGGRSLTPPMQANTNHPAWSLDGSRIVFSSGGDLYVVNSDGTGLQQLTFTPDIESNPVWRPGAVPPGSRALTGTRRGARR